MALIEQQPDGFQRTIDRPRVITTAEWASSRLDPMLRP
jgi:hypothetical protein